jgi:hypothetical protein
VRGALVYPCAFVTLKAEATATAEEIIAFWPRASGPLQGATKRYVRPVAEDLDRQDPKIRASRARE